MGVTPKCERCDDTFWVCEAHGDVKSNGEQPCYTRLGGTLFAWDLSVAKDTLSLLILKKIRAMIMTRMLIDSWPLVALLLGFVAGYLVRDSKSRQKFRRWHERHWY